VSTSEFATNFRSNQVLIANRCSIVNRGQLAEAGYGLGNEVQGELNIVGCVLLAEAEAEAGAGYFWR